MSSVWLIRLMALYLLIFSSSILAKPPRAAFIACHGKDKADKCFVKTSRRREPGQCLIPLGGQDILACVPDAHRKNLKHSKTQSLENSIVKSSVRNDYRYIHSNGIPDHKPGQFPNSGNPNRISRQNYQFKMPLHPQKQKKPIDITGYYFGVALNGVPFDPGTAEYWQGDRRWRYEALSGFLNLGLDDYNAHVQPSGAYHYHGSPVHLKNNSNKLAEAIIKARIEFMKKNEWKLKSINAQKRIRSNYPINLMIEKYYETWGKI